ncbi:hypothetical protein NHX12_001818 [Muraenolepis orangiensis]|uniref:Uncharacterized protein n=1 Tax=Muraenolepis orangiensis TaxID=630683 RepID=A0A9Q0E5A8_9TELE|nr:hypothetical protein NHX12_001818 [Muraenolepis orangiensis]
MATSGGRSRRCQRSAGPQEVGRWRLDILGCGGVPLGLDQGTVVGSLSALTPRLTGNLNIETESTPCRGRAHTDYHERVLVGHEVLGLHSLVSGTLITGRHFHILGDDGNITSAL